MITNMFACPCKMCEGKFYKAYQNSLEILTFLNEFFKTMVVSSSARCNAYNTNLYKGMNKEPTKNSKHIPDKNGVFSAFDIQINAKSEIDNEINEILLIRILESFKDLDNTLYYYKILKDDKRIAYHFHTINELS